MKAVQFLIIVVLSAILQITVGLNCTGDEDGRCQEVVCPGDSEPLSAEGGCRCVPARCHEPPSCPEGRGPVLKKRATLKPGDCCDVFECPSDTHQEVDCSRVVCREEASAEPCPADSYKLPAVRKDGQCCSEAQGCACLPAPCPVPACPHTSQLTVLAKGDAKPGSCCPIYQCTSHSGSNRSCLVEGKEVESGAKWSPNKCTECRCEKGLELCASASQCPPLPRHCLRTHTPPDACCPVCDDRPSDRIDNNIDSEKWRYPRDCGFMVDCLLSCDNGLKTDDAGCPICECNGSNSTCTVEGKELKDGERWTPNKCSECRCDKGVVLCASVAVCPPLVDDCEGTYIPPDTCCPVCFDSSETSDAVGAKAKGCLSSDGVFYEDGSNWKLDDCINCTCVDGKQVCNAALCVQTCSDPVIIKGLCCPVCNNSSIYSLPEHCHSLSGCNLKCKNGFVKDETNCFTCQCKEEECKVKCPNGYKRDGSGREVCECSAPNSRCLDVSNCPRRCRQGYKINSAGCQTCKCCKPLDTCNKICPHGFKLKSGCPVCSCQGAGDINNDVAELHCTAESGERRDDGESWEDECRQCYCSQGKEMCTLVVCPKIDCSQPLVFSNNSCCPTCPGSDRSAGGEGVCFGDGGGLRREGEEWTQGECVECRCLGGGRVVCMREPCPPTPCLHPVPPPQGSCCPYCPPIPPPLPDEPSCGVGREAGVEWRESECKSCVCISGVATCYDESCDQSPCDTPVIVKNQCCPVCTDSWTRPLGSCRKGNITFAVGAELELEPCLRCICLPGPSMSCSSAHCSKSERDYEWLKNPLYLGLLLSCITLFTCILLFIGVNHFCLKQRDRLKLGHDLSIQPYSYSSVNTKESKHPV